MRRIGLFILLSMFVLTSIFARADDYAHLRNRLFVLEKSEYMDDMYKYLVCLLSTGDQGGRTMIQATAYCKNPHIQNLVVQETQPTDQMAYSTLKPYGNDLQTMILCLARGGSKSSRATTAQVIEYCDKVTAPMD